MPKVRSVYSNGSSLVLTLPLDYCELAGIRKGSDVIVTLTAKHHIVVQKLTPQLDLSTEAVKEASEQ